MPATGAAAVSMVTVTSRATRSQAKLGEFQRTFLGEAPPRKIDILIESHEQWLDYQTYKNRLIESYGPLDGSS